MRLPIPLRTVLVLGLMALAQSAVLAEPLSKEQGDQILSELKAIRALLEKQALSPAAGQRPPQPGQPQVITLPSSAGHAALGAKDAPVTIVEFTDLQCPYCAKFSEQTFPELRKALIDTGKVRFESRDLPLNFHKFAVPAAVAARCAAEQRQYWQYRELLFSRQKELASAPYEAIAAGLNLDIQKFNSCRQSLEVTKAVQADGAAANALGITGTPTFLIGRSSHGTFTGEKLSGAQPFAAFESKVKALLDTK